MIENAENGIHNISIAVRKNKHSLHHLKAPSTEQCKVVRYSSEAELCRIRSAVYNYAEARGFEFSVLQHPDIPNAVRIYRTA